MQHAWGNQVGIVLVSGNVWSRSARRKTQVTTSTDETKLGFRLSAKVVSNHACQVAIEWRIGTDFVTFQSFCGKVRSLVQQTQQEST